MDASTPIVWIVTQDEALRDATSHVLLGTTARAISFSNTEDFFEQAYLDSPGCVLVDSGLPGVDALKLQQWLAELGSHLPIILLTDGEAMRTAAYAMRDGAFDLVEKPIDQNHLLEIVHAALERDRQNLEKQARHDAQLRRLRRLSPREFQVMKLVVGGHANKRIARELEISVKTVEAHRARVMEKMGVQSLPDLVRLVLQCDGSGGLLPDAD